MTNELLARIELLEKENKKLQKKLKEKQTEVNALVQHLTFKYEYSQKRIFHIIENYKKQ